MVFLKVKITGIVTVPPDQLHSKSDLFRRNAIRTAVKHIAGKKASRENGYFVAFSTADSINGEAQLDELSGKFFLPVSLAGITVSPMKGEILIGTIDKIMQHGVLLKSGLIQNVFLPETMMKDYRYRMKKEGALFLHASQPLKMEKGDKVRFRVFEVKWIESETDFHVLATIAGDFLGPVR